MSMRDTYQAAIAACKGHMEGNAEERDGKLHFKGTVGTEEEKNRIWDAIKTVPTWQQDIVADIRVEPKVSAGGGGTAAKTYTVAAGDTLSRIAQQTLGDAKHYMKIFEANRDQLSDPDKIRPGQVLKIPA